MPFSQPCPCARTDFGSYYDTTGHQTSAHSYATTENENDFITSKLNPVNSNAYYVQPCMEGTRGEILEEIFEWLDDMYAEENILWVNGSPGAGKSAIASSLMTSLAAQRRLGGSFCFRRANAALSNPSSMWKTIASQLAWRTEDAARHITMVLSEGRLDPDSPNIQNHFNQLIKEPLIVVENRISEQAG